MSGDWAASALSWWQEAGVDTIVGEEPRDWLNPLPRPTAAPAATPAAPEALPGDLAGFRDWLLTSDLFPAGPRVGPSGDPASGLMMLIDMPGPHDAQNGRLVSGDASDMFERMLGKIGRSRETIYLGSLMPARTPTGMIDSTKAAAFAEAARHHIGLVAPKAVLLFGDAVSKTLLGAPMLAARGTQHSIDTGSGPIKAFVTMSLQFLLQRPAARHEALQDLTLLMEGLKP